MALKRLKMENEKEGFPVTSLREINMLLKCGTHPNVVRLRVCTFAFLPVYFVRLFNFIYFRKLLWDPTLIKSIW